MLDDEAQILVSIYARLAARELSFHRTQYGDAPAKALATNNLSDYEQPLPFILAKSLVGGTVTGDIMDGVRSGALPFTPVRGYRSPDNTAAAHDDLTVRIRLVAPTVEKSQWQTITWTADAGGKEIGPVTLKVYVGGK